MRGHAHNEAHDFTTYMFILTFFDAVPVQKHELRHDNGFNREDNGSRHLSARWLTDIPIVWSTSSQRLENHRTSIKTVQFVRGVVAVRLCKIREAQLFQSSSNFSRVSYRDNRMKSLGCENKKVDCRNSSQG